MKPTWELMEKGMSRVKSRFLVACINGCTVVIFIKTDYEITFGGERK